MLILVFAGMETALHMGILAETFFHLFGKEEYKGGKRLGIWLWFALLCVIEVLRRLFAAGSLDSVWFLGALEGCWLWNYGRGRGSLALVWGIFLHCTELLLHMPAQIMDDGLDRAWNAFGLVTHTLSMREGAVSLGIFALFFLLCFWQRERLFRLLKFMLELSGSVFLLAGVLEYCLAYYLISMGHDQDEGGVLWMNCMILVCLALGLILLYLWFRFRDMGKERKMALQQERMRWAERNRKKRRIIYVVQIVCLLFLFRFGMQLQVNGAWIADGYEHGNEHIDWFSTTDNLFIFLFPILLSAADLFLALRKKEWVGGAVRVCFLVLNWVVLLLGTVSARDIYLAMQAFVAG